MRRATDLTAAALASSVLLASAATAADIAEVGDLEGDWRGEGQFRGAASYVTARFAPALDGAFWSLDVVTHADAGEGAPMRFAGRAYYRLEDGATSTGRWFDSFGGFHELSTRVEDGAFVVDWGDASVQGRSIHRLADDGALTVEDQVLGDDSARAFAVATLRRVGSP
jgi:hypothetical protein